MSDPVAADRLELVIGLMQGILGGEGVVIHAPTEVTRDPAALLADDAPERLAGTRWWLRLDGGREELVTFTELVVLTSNLILVATKLRQARPPDSDPRGVTVSFGVNASQIADSELVRRLLGNPGVEGRAEAGG